MKTTSAPTVIIINIVLPQGNNRSTHRNRRRRSRRHKSGDNVSDAARTPQSSAATAPAPVGNEVAPTPLRHDSETKPAPAPHTRPKSTRRHTHRPQAIATSSPDTTPQPSAAMSADITVTASTGHEPDGLITTDIPATVSPTAPADASCCPAQPCDPATDGSGTCCVTTCDIITCDTAAGSAPPSPPRATQRQSTVGGMFVRTIYVSLVRPPPVSAQQPEACQDA